MPFSSQIFVLPGKAWKFPIFPTPANSSWPNILISLGNFSGSSSGNYPLSGNCVILIFMFTSYSVKTLVVHHKNFTSPWSFLLGDSAQQPVHLASFVRRNFPWRIRAPVDLSAPVRRLCDTVEFDYHHEDLKYHASEVRYPLRRTLTTTVIGPRLSAWKRHKGRGENVSLASVYWLFFPTRHSQCSLTIIEPQRKTFNRENGFN